MYVKKTGSKGSITIEACISFPVFLFFFYLLLFLVKAACINLIMDHAVSETARYFAASLYPLSFLNEYEDEKIESLGELPLTSLNQHLAGDIAGTELSEGVLKTLLSPGEMSTDSLESVLGQFREYLNNDSYGALGLNILEVIYREYQTVKDRGKYYLAEQVLKGYLQDSWIIEDKTSLLLVKFPEGRNEYAIRGQAEVYENFHMQPGRDFERDDVVILAEYSLELPIPFFSGKDISLRYAAIERAWLRGSNGVYTRSEEGLDLVREDNKKEYVYATRTGSKYHIYSSCAYLEKSCIPLTRDEAEGRGLSPHKGCPHRFK